MLRANERSFAIILGGFQANLHAVVSHALLGLVLGYFPRVSVRDIFFVQAVKVGALRDQT